MKLMSLGAVLVSLSLVSCQTRRQTLPPELARHVDGIFGKWDRADSVSYTHLDVYKRQTPHSSSVFNGSHSTVSEAVAWNVAR